jgi:hypothetical protein
VCNQAEDRAGSGHCDSLATADSLADFAARGGRLVSAFVRPQARLAQLPS